MTIYTKSGESLLYEKESYILRGIWMKIYNELGPGHKESVYVKAFIQELKEGSIPHISEPVVNLYRKGEKIGTFRPDLIIWNKIVVEFKAVDFLPKVSEKQLESYLVGSKFKLGFLVNFGGKWLVIKRKIHDRAKKINSLSKS